jgi:hypothetical protein
MGPHELAPLLKSPAAQRHTPCGPGDKLCSVPVMRVTLAFLLLLSVVKAACCWVKLSVPNTATVADNCCPLLRTTQFALHCKEEEEVGAVIYC